MTEPDVALTDYALALECVLFLVLLPGRKCPTGFRSWFTIFFAAMGTASVCGGTVHGFFVDEQSTGYAILWPVTLLAIGVTTFATWAIGAELLFPPRIVRRILVAAGVQLVLYSLVVLFLTQEFWVAVADNLPAILFLLVAIGAAYRREKHPLLLVAAAGPCLTLVASVLQRLHIGVHPVYFNHNSLYHLLQAIALLLFFLGGRRLVAQSTHIISTSS